MLRRSGGTASPMGDCAAVSGTCTLVRSSTSDLSGFEVDARIDPRISQVRDQVDQKSDQRQDVECCEHDRIVAVEHTLEAEQTKPIERKDGFDEQRTGEERTHEGARKAGDDNQHRVAEDV